MTSVRTAFETWRVSAVSSEPTAEGRRLDPVDRTWTACFTHPDVKRLWNIHAHPLPFVVSKA